MKKLPYFPFYYLDWLSSSSVSMMTHEEKGLFIDMLSRCYNDDGLPNDADKLQRLFNCDIKTLSTVSEMFYSVEGLLKNKKLDSIIKDQSSMIKDKSKAGKASAKARADKRLQKSTAVEHVLNPVATEVQQNPTNRTEQNRTEQNISINPEETVKPKPSSWTVFYETYPKPFNPMCSYTKSAFYEAVSNANGEDVVLAAVSMYANYFKKTKKPLQYASKAQEWLESRAWNTDWNAEALKSDNQNKKGLSNSAPSVIKKGDVF